jgi:formylglycine-generating enzyme required for sulfatase activity
MRTLDKIPTGTTDAAIDFTLIPEEWSTTGDDNGRSDERPAHRVWTRAFEMGVVPVTNAQYAEFLSGTGHEAPRFWDDLLFNQPDQPVVGVSWPDAVAYCGWLTSLTGRQHRLPTEAEREKSARGGAAGLTFPWGNDLGPEAGRFLQDRPRPVGLMGPNGYGLFDMTYNVHEWCSDWYSARYYLDSPERDPQGPPSGTRRASRGGAWRHAVKVSRSAARSSIPPEFRYNDYGFRVVRDI